jgi:error-prone DNA polymerase
MGYYPARVLVADARRCGVKVLPIDINKSEAYYTVQNGAIRVSLRQLRGMSDEALESIVKARDTGAFKSLTDFILRTKVSQNTIENLINVGALESFGSKEDLLSQLDNLLRLKRKIGKFTKPLFDLAEDNLDTASKNGVKAAMLMERELLSLDLSAHPLDFVSIDNSFTRMKDLPSIATGRTIKIAGSVIRYQTPPTRNGNRVVYVIMEDGTGIADVTVFGDVQERCGRVLFREGWLAVTGKVQRRGPKALSIIAEELAPLNSNAKVAI